jgi:membrane associated rhomboid family serine protease
VIPLRDANPTKRFPVVTLALIAANVAVFLLWQPTFGTQLEQVTFYYCHAEIPWEVSHQENLAQGGLDARAALDEDLGPGNGRDVQSLVQVECPNKSWWLAIFVAMFLHGGWFHIAGNMLFLWVFGNNVEDRLGYVVYPLFYVLGGLAASALQLAFGANSTIPNLGASGAIGGILGAYIVLFPRARVTTLVIFFFITVVEIPAGRGAGHLVRAPAVQRRGSARGGCGRRGGVLGARRRVRVRRARGLALLPASRWARAYGV